MAGGPAALTRALHRMAERLPADGPAGLTLLCGLADPMLPGPRPDGPLAVLAATGPDGPPPWAPALLEAAAIRLVLTEADLDALGEAGGAPVIGLPAPPLTEPEPGLDVDGTSDAALEIWIAEMGAVPHDGPGVTWIRGRGSAPLAAAADGWARGRVVVALPGTADHPLLRRGGVLRSRTTLEAVEATALVRRTAPLAWTLASRGRRAIASLPSLEQVAGRLAEVLAAGDRGDEGPV